MKRQTNRLTFVNTGSTHGLAVTRTAAGTSCKGEVDINSRVNVSGTVNLILADGCNLKINGGINVSGGNSLTIYGQDEGTGALTATGADSQAGIGGGRISIGRRHHHQRRLDNGQ